MRRAGIALGSNLGDRAANLRHATAFLACLHQGPPEEFFVSGIFETDPEDCAPETEPFFNAAAEIATSLSPRALMEALRSHESACGRPALREKNSPRTIDLDLIYLGETAISTEIVNLPHPRASARAFVMVPLAQIAPQKVLPGAVRTIGEIAGDLDRSGLRETGIDISPAGSKSFPPRESWIGRKKSGTRFATLTAYDFPMARLLDGLGLDFLLVGDSLGMVHLGRPDTTTVTMADMLHHTRAASAGARFTPLVADLPIGACGDVSSALANANALVEAGASAVKMEGGSEILPQVAAVVGSGIPCVGHLGMLPQRVREEGGYKIKGKTDAEADSLLEDARKIEGAGVSAIVLELVRPQVAARLTAELAIPTIGIGSGEACDGNILVTHDLLGFFPWFRPCFATPKANLAGDILRAAADYRDEVREIGS